MVNFDTMIYDDYHNDNNQSNPEFILLQIEQSWTFGSLSLLLAFEQIEVLQNLAPTNLLITCKFYCQ